MAWQDVEGKLQAYAEMDYAPPAAAFTLLQYYGANTVDEVPEHRREEFEADLDYRMGACANLASSHAVRP